MGMNWHEFFWGGVRGGVRGEGCLGFCEGCQGGGGGKGAYCLICGEGCQEGEACQCFCV
jgi:hypothetical protein